jgi:hypothetical protein
MTTLARASTANSWPHPEPKLPTRAAHFKGGGGPEGIALSPIPRDPSNNGAANRIDIVASCV